MSNAHSILRPAAFAATGLALSFAAAGAVSAQPRLHEIAITIEQVKAIDQIDAFSKGDFYARVTIDGEVQKTPVIKQQASVAPNWKIVQKVAPGKHDVKLEIFDKDVSVDDAIDVNPLNANRVLAAVIDTKRCRVTGYGRTYRCGAKIAVAGNERKAAEVTFKVDVTR